MKHGDMASAGEWDEGIVCTYFVTTLPSRSCRRRRIPSEFRTSMSTSMAAIVIPVTTFEGVPFSIRLPDTEHWKGDISKIYTGKISGYEEPPIVAVKIFAPRLGHAEEQLRAARQASMRYHSITPFLGTAFVGPEHALVSVYMKNGNLLEYLKAGHAGDRRRLLCQVADAVKYLHAGQGLVHGNLKCANVLISDFGQALLADVGLCTFLEKAGHGEIAHGSLRFAAPELLLGRPVVLDKTGHSDIARGLLRSAQPELLGGDIVLRKAGRSDIAHGSIRFAAPELLLEGDPSSSRSGARTRETDVYAFGMLILEAITERQPWGNLSNMTVLQSVCLGKLPPRPAGNGLLSGMSSAWWQTCLRCWNFEPSDRPDMQTILHGLSHDESNHILQGHKKAVSSVAYAPRGSRIVSASLDQDIRVWDQATSQTLITVTCHADIVWSLSFSPDGGEVASCSSDGTIRIWDALSGSELAPPMSESTGDVRCVAYSPKGRSIVSASDITVSCYDTATGSAGCSPFRGHTDIVSSVAFSPDGTMIVSGSFDGTIRVWDASTGEPLATLRGHEKELSSVCFFPDGRRIASGSWDHTVRIWNTATMALEFTLRGPISSVNAVAVSPSGRNIAAGAEDGMIQIWDTVTREQVGAPLTGHLGCVNAVAFSPDGKSLASGSRDKTIRIWDLFE